MFAEAYKLATRFTKPLFDLVNLLDGRTTFGNDSAVIINQEGWFLTAAHCLNNAVAFAEHQPAVRSYNDEVVKIEANPRLDAKQKRKRIGRLQRDPNWVTGFQNFWAHPGGAPQLLQADPVYILKEHDLAIGKMLNYQRQHQDVYPVFKDYRDASDLHPGTSLCRLGFPFTATSFSQNPDGSVDIRVSNVTFFPNEGILTRVFSPGKDAAGHQILFIETSSPGLKGQSGGPIFDKDGRVWGIQTGTIHFPLGFDPPDPANPNRRIHQYLNAGLGVHPQTLLRVMGEFGVSFASK